ncbi:GNAT family N-acetyltransferase [Daejeonella oryzae]|uniref:GNAT family N-acetyltransferase n=1 Tax=Daejeonella oryzae TaxID=1122943 RepID=UPI00047906B1|nr:GNAT family N-acetyltransferase [Daejeonella oryzae]
MIKLRPAVKDDIELLTNLGRTTFMESFSHLNNPIHFQKYLDENHVQKVIEAEFNNEKNYFFIAEYDNEPAGFFKIVFDEHEDQPLLKDKKCLELERIYILNKFQGLKISSEIIDKTFKIAADHQFELVWLGVWENNIKAITIYKKWGFEIFGSHIFNLGGDLQTDLLMRKNVNPHKN